VRAPTLLVVGGRDRRVLALNRAALEGLAGRARLEVVAGASHLFPEPGALERVAELAVAWFLAHLAGELASEQATP
jgi:putative phosphoribosyl transferase